MKKYGFDTYLLSDVFYLQNSDTTTTTTTDTDNNSNLTLVPLINDLHTPRNHIVLNKENIIYWQNLQTTSPIIDAIIKSKNSSD